MRALAGLSAVSSGGLRPAKSNIYSSVINDIDDTVTDDTYRQLQVQKHIPKRAKIKSDVEDNELLSLTKFVTGVWEQIHSGINVEPQKLLDYYFQSTSTQKNLISLLPSPSASGSSLVPAIPPLGNNDNTDASFTQKNLLCCRITQLSSTCRSVEIIVQAHWIECFDAYAAHLASSKGPRAMSATKARMAAFRSACRDFGWSEQELRNKMAVWRVYKEIKDAGEWAMLIFAGIGLHRMCKYRVGFGSKKDGDQGVELRRVLRAARERVALAADTLHPEWRGLLAVIGVEDNVRRRQYTGHPHDWVVADGGAVVPLRATYRDGYLDEFEHINECVVDAETWAEFDPRWTIPSGADSGGNAVFVCQECRQEQSTDPKVNNCHCFPTLFGCAKRLPCPVQIIRTANGRNNGLQALVSFERGVGIGEFVGLVTKGIESMDVMDTAVGPTKYQIWQGRQGNFTRFINHSCKPNAQFQPFIWMGRQHVILVSKGIEAGCEITVDYSPRYWHGLSKKCLCGDRCCRYR